MLKEFRSIDVYWDKATRRIYEEIRSSSSDEKGRKLTVQIVNDGQIQDLTNVALNLYWETQDGESRGLDSFEPLDLENGIYELYFRTGMLQHVGKLNAHLHLVDTTGAITSEPFTIVVFEGVDVDAMASDDELSALNQALIEVQNIKQDEAERVANEQLRVSAETERITAEEERVSSENERRTAETIRVSNETNRVDAEDARNTNETNRVDAENNRVTAETARVTAEEEREQGYPALDGRITAVEQNIDSHLADMVTDVDGAHGLKIEAGTFTPRLRGQTTHGINTYSIQLGTYHKIGKRVFIDLHIALSTKDVAMAGDIVISDLPFVISTGNDSIISMTIGRNDNIAYTGSLRANANNGFAHINLLDTKSGVYATTITEGDIASNTIIAISGSYLTL